MPQPNRFVDAEGNRKPDAPPGANQFTTGKRTGHSEATKDKIRAEKAARLLEQEIDGEAELSDGKRASAKILMEYGKPKLSAVEQTTVNELEAMSEGELVEQLRALITAKPELIPLLNLAPKPVEVGHVAVLQGKQG